MAYAREFARWNHTADLLAAIANTIPTANGEPFTRSDFHPYLQKPEDKEDTVRNGPDDVVAYLEDIGL